MKRVVGEKPEKVVLASESPRRQEMLRALQILFEEFIPGVAETWSSRKDARETAVELARRKVMRYRGNPGALVIAMDTIVVVDRVKLGKPRTAEEAKRMLRRLSGKSHQVITGAALMWNGKVRSGSAVTRVQFRKIHEEELDWYVKTGEPFDKAGAYAIQGLARIFITSINGCYYNVVGFPLTLFQRLLGHFGLRIFDLTQSSR